MRAFLFALLAFGCAGSVAEEPPACVDGLLVVEGEASRILATFDEVAPTAHLSDPPMRLANSEDGCRRADGCLVFIPQTVASSYRIESWNPETGESLCPIALEVERP